MKNDMKVKWVFMLPFMIPLLLFWIIPLASAFFISLTDWDYISPTFNFVGIENYVYMLTDPDFIEALINTFYFSVTTIVGTIILGLAFALIFQKKFSGSRVYQLIIFSPWITPTVAVSLVWSWIYEPDKGFANYLLGLMGIAPLKWLHSSESAMLAIIIFTIWKSIGWTMLFYLGAVERVPQSTYEAARIDGAGYWSQFFHITLPLISPTTFFLFIVNLISTIQVYDQIQMMTQGGPGGSTTTLLYLYYEKAFQNFQMGPANAVAMVILLLILVLSLISTYVSSRFVHYD
ncbi:sugar ABC transporter permease [Fusibacter paucivorans]|uniref:Sugar ABC transporter permease n=1 Tax=Fusibacter paucivorans TaxID=76009 RepID=A0ABS5PJM5_9FIRM|nr:sugar ABC transporter permease [Fusibacter paucivorans]MBS7525339.1 sugar ABC transporter permease [Fusibacter paucivorans]